MGINVDKLKQNAVAHVDTTKFKPMRTVSSAKSALTITHAGDVYRTRLSIDVYDTLGKPENVDVAFFEDMVLITSHPDNSGDYSVKKGRIIYSAELADAIMALDPDIDFTLKGSTPCGKVIQNETLEEGSVEIVIQLWG